MPRVDYEDLEIDRARIAVSVDAARRLVEGWMGGVALDEDEDLAEQLEKRARQQPAAPARREQALEKIRAEVEARRRAGRSDAVARRPRQGSNDDDGDSDDAAYGRSAMLRARRQ